MRYDPARPDVGRLLRRKVRELAEETALLGRVADPATLAEVDALARVHALQSTARGSGRLLKGAVVGVLALAMVVLYGWRAGSTAVSAEVLAGEVAFELGSARNVLAAERLSGLWVSGLDSVRLPRDGGREEVFPAGALALRVDSAAGAGTIDLADAVLPVGTRVRLRGSEAGAGYVWDIVFPDSTAGRAELVAAVSGSVRSSAEGRGDTALAPPYGAQVVLYPGRELQLHAVFADTATRLLDPQPRARTLAFDHPDPFPSAVREISSLVSGTVVLEQLNGRELKLGAGQVLHFDSTDVDVHLLALEARLVRVRFGGRVHGMSTGTYHRRDLMPRRLEQYAAADPVLVLGTLLAAVAGSALLVVDWFRAR